MSEKKRQRKPVRRAEKNAIRPAGAQCQPTRAAGISVPRGFSVRYGRRGTGSDAPRTAPRL
jgi:hypothetical protein